jgi:hypothetical protein
MLIVASENVQEGLIQSLETRKEFMSATQQNVSEATDVILHSHVSIIQDIRRAVYRREWLVMRLLT